MIKNVVITSCLLLGALLQNGNAEPDSKPLVVEIEAPSTGWQIRIESLHTKGKELLVICHLAQSEGMHAPMISKIKDSVPVPVKLVNMPRKIYVTGRTWNWGKGYTAIDEKALKKLLDGSTNVYTRPETKASDPDAGDFIGLTLEEAETLATKRKLSHRVVSKDGKSQPATTDFNPNRINFTVVDGRVTQTTEG